MTPTQAFSEHELLLFMADPTAMKLAIGGKEAKVIGTHERRFHFSLYIEHVGGITVDKEYCMVKWCPLG